jgi:hypothetical protein
MIKIPFFIDALSINQFDSKERSYQVKMMGELYRTANEVIIWLGLPDPNDTLLHTGLKSLCHRNDWTATNDNCKEEESYALQNIGRCYYWDRMWIVQEILLSVECKVLYGEYDFTWDKIVSIRPKLYNPAESSLVRLKGLETGVLATGP